LIGIGSGLIAVYGLLNEVAVGWTMFLVSTVLTSVTGFLFPVEHLLPSHKVGIISLVVLGLRSRASIYFISPGNGGPSTLSARSWPSTSTALSQSFSLPQDPRAARHGAQRNEPPFLVAQTIVLLVFIVLGVFATKRFRGVPTLAT
jgi:hypothetical protein